MNGPAVTTDAGAIVSLERMLAARDYRVACQVAALARFDRPIVSTTVVMPGPVKDGDLPRRLLTAAVQAVDAMASSNGWSVLLRESRWCDTGPEAIYVVDAEPQQLKKGAVELEEQHPLGRLWDIDVITPGRHILSRKQLGFPERRCLLCEQRASECGRSRRHAVPELLEAIQRIVNDYDAH